MDSYLIPWVIIHDYHYLFLILKDCLRLGQCEPLQAGFWVLSIYRQGSLSTSLFLAQEDVSGSSHTFSAEVCPPRNPGSPNWRVVFRKQGMGVLYAHCN